MRTWLGVVIAVAACKGNAAEKQPPVVAAPAGSAVGSAVVVPAKPSLSKAQLADYKKHMTAGWALQKESKWADAVPEFEAALAAGDVDPRALTELGWTAMNAGDYKIARRADDQAVRLAVDPRVKAAALFNLGTVEAKTGNVDDARDSFTPSLALRPNKTVAAALAALGAAAEVDKPLCEPTQDACTCLREHIQPDAEDFACVPVTEPMNPVPAFKAYDIKLPPWSYRYLLDEHQDQVAIIAQSLDRMRVTEDLTLDKMDLKTIGGHSVLWIETTDKSMETGGHEDSMSVDTDELHQVTVCSVGDAKTPTRCPIQGLPLTSSHSGDVVAASGSDKSGSSKPARLALPIGSDGIATVTVPAGASDAGLESWVGPHKLW